MTAPKSEMDRAQTPPFTLPPGFRCVGARSISPFLKKHIGDLPKNTETGSSYYWATMDAEDGDTWNGGWCNEMRTAFWTSGIGARKLIIPLGLSSGLMFEIELTTDDVKQEDWRQQPQPNQ